MEPGERPLHAVLIQPYAGEAEGRLDVAAIIRFLLRRWLLLALFTIGGGILLLGLSFLLTPKYRAETILAPVEADSSSSGLSSLLNRYGSLASAVGIDVGGADSTTIQALALLQSRGFIEQFIMDKALLKELYPGDFTGKPGLFRSKPHTLQEAYDGFVRETMLVMQDSGRKLVTLRIEWRDRELAAVWANELVERVNASMRADAILEANKSLEYLRDELKAAEIVELQKSISSLIEAQINRRMLANTRPDYVFKVIDRARPADADRPAFPRKIVFVALGMLLGLAFGVFVAVWKVDARQPAESR